MLSADKLRTADSLAYWSTACTNTEALAAVLRLSVLWTKLAPISAQCPVPDGGGWWRMVPQRAEELCWLK